eukprot:scaffold90852_cov27-Tisochrysis_lutea.AAC.1
MRLSSSLLACAFALACDALLDVWKCDDQRCWKADNISVANATNSSVFKNFSWSHCDDHLDDGKRQVDDVNAAKEDLSAAALQVQEATSSVLSAMETASNTVVKAEHDLRSARREATNLLLQMKMAHTRELDQLAEIESQRRAEALAKMQAEVDGLSVQAADAAAEAALARVEMQRVTVNMEEQLASMREEASSRLMELQAAHEYELTKMMEAEKHDRVQAVQAAVEAAEARVHEAEHAAFKAAKLQQLAEAAATRAAKEAEVARTEAAETLRQTKAEYQREVAEMARVEAQRREEEVAKIKGEAHQRAIEAARALEEALKAKSAAKLLATEAQERAALLQKEAEKQATELREQQRNALQRVIAAHQIELKEASRQEELRKATMLGEAEDCKTSLAEAKAEAKNAQKEKTSREHIFQAYNQERERKVLSFIEKQMQEVYHGIEEAKRAADEIRDNVMQMMRAEWHHSAPMSSTILTNQAEEASGIKELDSSEYKLDSWLHERENANKVENTNVVKERASKVKKNADKNAQGNALQSPPSEAAGGMLIFVLVVVILVGLIIIFRRFFPRCRSSGSSTSPPSSTNSPPSTPSSPNTQRSHIQHVSPSTGQSSRYER